MTFSVGSRITSVRAIGMVLADIVELVGGDRRRSRRTFEPRESYSTFSFIAPSSALGILTVAQHAALDLACCGLG
jgi:hypothetical protein